MHYEKFADGTIKCIEDEIPFDIPDIWEWARLKHICAMAAGKAKPSCEIKSEPFESSYPCFGGNGIRGYVDEYNQEGTFSIIGRQGALCGNINIASGKFYATEHAVVTTLFSGIDFDWSNYALEALQLNKYATGAAQPGLSVANVLNALVPVPPTCEQQHIGRVVSSAIKIIEQIAVEKEELHSILNQAKKHILDHAIRGQLVPQDPDDEPASVLVERIRAEKEELIRQGKLKRDKRESVIFRGEDNSYYTDLPETWTTTTLNEITTSASLNDGDWILSENMNSSGKVKLIQLGSIGEMHYIDKGFKYLTEETFDALSCTQIYSGYLLVNRIISDKMCACILPEIDGTLITTVDTCWIAPNDMKYDLNYLLIVLSSPFFQQLVLMNTAGTTRKRISKNNLIQLPFPFPPIREQRRIADAVKQYLSILDNIATQIA